MQRDVEIEMEIEKLKMRKVDLTNSMNITTDYEEKETIKEAIGEIQRQISILEKMKG